MNKAELIDAVSSRLGIEKKSADHAVEAIIDTITRTVAKGEKVALTGFGVFEKVERAARTARNPATGATVRVKKTSVPKFRPGTNFKQVTSGAKKLAKAAPAPAKAAKSTTTAKATKAAPAKKAGAKKAAPAKATKATKATAKKAAPAKRPTTKKTTARATAAKSTARKATAKKATARKTTAKKAPAKRATKR